MQAIRQNDLTRAVRETISYFIEKTLSDLNGHTGFAKPSSEMHYDKGNNTISLSFDELDKVPEWSKDIIVPFYTLHARINKDLSQAFPDIKFEFNFAKKQLIIIDVPKLEDREKINAFLQIFASYDPSNKFIAKLLKSESPTQHKDEKLKPPKFTAPKSAAAVISTNQTTAQFNIQEQQPDSLAQMEVQQHDKNLKSFQTALDNYKKAKQSFKAQMAEHQYDQAFSILKTQMGPELERTQKLCQKLLDHQKEKGKISQELENLKNYFKTFKYALPNRKQALKDYQQAEDKYQAALSQNQISEALCFAENRAKFYQIAFEQTKLFTDNSEADFPQRMAVLTTELENLRRIANLAQAQKTFDAFELQFERTISNNNFEEALVCITKGLATLNQIEQLTFDPQQDLLNQIAEKRTKFENVKKALEQIIEIRKQSAELNTKNLTLQDKIANSNIKLGLLTSMQKQIAVVYNAVSTKEAKDAILGINTKIEQSISENKQFLIDYNTQNHGPVASTSTATHVKQSGVTEKTRLLPERPHTLPPRPFDITTFSDLVDNFRIRLAWYEASAVENSCCGNWLVFFKECLSTMGDNEGVILLKEILAEITDEKLKALGDNGGSLSPEKENELLQKIKNTLAAPSSKKPAQYSYLWEEPLPEYVTDLRSDLIDDCSKYEDFLASQKGHQATSCKQ